MRLLSIDRFIRKSVMGVCALLRTTWVGLPVFAGCCVHHKSGINSVYSKGLNDPVRCANVGGKITSLENCAAKQGAGKMVVID